LFGHPPTLSEPGLVIIMLYFALLLSKSDLTFIPHKLPLKEELRATLCVIFITQA
jgi:hypothetical protein